MKKINYILLVLLISVSCNRDNTELFNKACVYEEQGDFENAIVFLTKAIEVNPNDIECYNNRAWDFYELGMHQKAYLDFQKIAEIDSTNTAGIYGLGFLQYEQGNYSEAVRLFEKIIQLKGGGPLFFEAVDNDFINQRIIEADLDQVFHYKYLAEEELKENEP